MLAGIIFVFSLDLARASSDGHHFYTPPALHPVSNVLVSVGVPCLWSAPVAPVKLAGVLYNSHACDAAHTCWNVYYQKDKK